MKDWKDVRTEVEERVLPAIHELMAKGDPYLYIRYGGRCCKHTAYLLSRYLEEQLPEYEWSSWGGLFEDDWDSYRHAWVYGKSLTGKKNLILDYGKTKEEYAFFMECGENTYPESLRHHDNRFCEDIDQFDKEDSMELDTEDEDERKEIVTDDDSVQMSFVNCSFDHAYQLLRQQLSEKG